MNFSSKLLENAVNEMSQLPGIGKRTALKFSITFITPTTRLKPSQLSQALQ